MVKFYMILHDPDVLCCHEWSDPHQKKRPFLVKNSLWTKGNTQFQTQPNEWRLKWVYPKSSSRHEKPWQHVFKTAMVTWEYEIPHVRNPTYVVVFQCISYSQSPWLLGFPTIVIKKVAFSP